eukprot:m51a1_g9798 putative adenylate guanylate cyclase (555) ;mRNA; r:1777792-1784778
MFFESPLAAPKPVRFGRRTHLPLCCRDVQAQRAAAAAQEDSELRDILRSTSRAEAEESVVLMPQVGASPDIERPGNPLAQHIADRSRRYSNASITKESALQPERPADAPVSPSVSRLPIRVAVGLVAVSLAGHAAAGAADLGPQLQTGSNTSSGEVPQRAAAGQQQKIASEEVVIRRAAGGELSVLVSVAQSRVLGATSYALFLRDISQLKQRERELGDQQRSAEQLLFNILPRSLVRDIAWAPLPGATDGAEAPEIRVAARAYESVTILFADIVEFTQATAQLDGEAVVLVLNALVSQWDRLALEFGVEKIKTIGSCFMAAAGVPVPSADNAELMAEFAIAMLWETKAHNKTARVPMQVRIGLNTGKVVAGVLGLHKIAYDLWGDTVNVAARMQTASLPDRIQVSEMTFEKLQGRGYAFSKREKTLIKGKGAMDCYLLEVGTAQEIEAALEASGGVVPVRSESLRWRRRADCDPDGTRQQQGKSDNREGTELGPLASEVEQRNSAVLALPQRTASAMATSHHPATEDTVASAEQLPAEKKETEAAEVSEDKGE